MARLPRPLKSLFLRYPRLGRRLGIGAVYLFFLCTAGSYLTNLHRYAGVEHWPSTDARLLGETGQTYTFQGQGRFGPTATTLDTRSVAFEYQVNSQTYAGDNAIPDGGFGLLAGKPNPLAYYNPKAPWIAVLYPVPYSGTGTLICAIVSGVMVAVHFFCALADRFLPKAPDAPPA